MQMYILKRAKLSILITSATLLLFALALLPAGCGWTTGRRNAAAPNVLLITLDTTRADRLGCYGYPLPTSPRIDALARTGVLFERAVAQASVTPVSHASIFTGLNPYHHGVRFLHGTYGYKLPPEIPTMSGILKARGYRTAGFVSAFPAGSRFGLESGFDTFDESFEGSHAPERVTPEGIVNTNRSQRIAGATTRAVFDWLDKAGEGPLFVWVHYFDPHDARLVPDDRSFMDRFRPRDSSPREWLIAMYDSEIAYMDDHVGKVVERFSALKRPLLVIIVGDHGQGLGDHNWWGHGLLYEEQIRVPFVLYGDGIPKGLRVPDLVRTVDILPTLLGLLSERGGGGQTPAPTVDGVDLRPMLKGEWKGPELEAYADAPLIMDYTLPYKPDERDKKNDQLFALTSGNWKYTLHRLRMGPDELYDLGVDPRETRNLITERADVAAALRARLMKASVFPKKTTILGGLSPEDIERLKSLGYLSSE